MSFFRNPEVKQSLFACFILTVIAVAAGAIIGLSYAVFALCLCVVFIVFFLIFTYARYRKIFSLTQEISLILHGNEELSLDDYKEGELAVLQSEIYKLTVRLREQADDLKQDKLFLSNAIADISHQIRTPLTSINLITTFLSEDNLDDKRRIRLTSELSKLLSRIDWLINSLLKMSRLDAGTVKMKHERIDICELIRKAYEPVAIPMELRAQQLEVKMAGDETFIGDLQWSTEALGNVLKNCMEHSPEGGRIELAVSENALFTQMIVHDSGNGIDSADLPHLFERFYKGKNSSEQSFGIGLALSRMILTAQNGTIKAENNPNGGANFIIRVYKSTV